MTTETTETTETTTTTRTDYTALQAAIADALAAARAAESLLVSRNAQTYCAKDLEIAIIRLEEAAISAKVAGRAAR